jgi:serine/threonine-protein kinase
MVAAYPNSLFLCKLLASLDEAARSIRKGSLPADLGRRQWLEALFYDDLDDFDRRASDSADDEFRLPDRWDEVRKGEIRSRYRLVAPLGNGVLSIACAAEDRRERRTVALKLIARNERAVGLAQWEKCREVARSASDLGHPNIIPVLDAGTNEGGAYIVDELKEGGSLQDQLAGLPQDPRQSAEWMVELTDAVGAAHEEGIIHRDLRPANILFNRAGRPRVADFWDGVLLSGHEDLLFERPVEKLWGKAGVSVYLAPEQIDGTSAVGPEADVFALGGILYEMLTGRCAFEASSLAEARGVVLQRSPESAPLGAASVPSGLAAIAQKCLDREPTRRYTNAMELHDELSRWLHRPTPSFWGQLLRGRLSG